MTAWYLLGSRWRRGLGGQVLLAVVVALAGTMVLATVAGARRTETAYDRFVEAARVPDVFLDTGGGAGVVLTDEQIRAVRALPQVAASTRLRAMAMAPAAERLYQPTAAPLDDGWGRDLAVSRFVEGRAPTAADEVSLTEQRAELLGLSIGNTLTMSSYTPEQIDLAKTGDESVFGDPQGPLIDLTLVGIERTPQSIATDRDIAAITILTPAFVEQYGDQIGSWSDLLALDLRDDEASLPGFSDAVRAVPGLEDLQFEAGGGSSAPAETLAFVAAALRILATIAALAGIATLGLVMLRGADAHTLDDVVLGGLGLDRRQRRRLRVLGVVPGTLAGLVMAATGAIVASALFPFGLGGRAEPDPGVDVDPIVLGVGLLLIAVVVVGLAFAVAVWAVRGGDRTVRRPRRSWLVRALEGVGAPCQLVVGGRFVLERNGPRRGMPARTATAGVALGSAGLIAVLVFSASQSSLVDEPAAWGRPWDIAAAEQHTGADVIPPEVVADRSVVHVAVVDLEGHPIEARGFEVVEGSSLIEVAEGRPPGAGEVVLGAATLDELGVGIGDIVTMKGATGEADLLVVGQGMFSGITDVPILDHGAALDQATLARISGPETEGFSTVAIRLEPGVDRDPIYRAVAESIAEENGIAVTEGDVDAIATGDSPDELDRLDEVRRLPWLLAGFLGLIAVTATAAVLISAVQRRRHDMAVLRAIGLDGDGVRAVVVSQATIVSVFGLTLGVPLGIMVGRATWRLVAEGFGVRVHLLLPIASILATIAVVVLVDVGVSLLPAHRTARAHPAEDLRAE